MVSLPFSWLPGSAFPGAKKMNVVDKPSHFFPRSNRYNPESTIQKIRTRPIHTAVKQQIVQGMHNNENEEKDLLLTKNSTLYLSNKQSWWKVCTQMFALPCAKRSKINRKKFFFPDLSLWWAENSLLIFNSKVRTLMDHTSNITSPKRLFPHYLEFLSQSLLYILHYLLIQCLLQK